MLPMDTYLQTQTENATFSLKARIWLMLPLEFLMQDFPMHSLSSA